MKCWGVLSIYMQSTLGHDDDNKNDDDDADGDDDDDDFHEP